MTSATVEQTMTVDEILAQIEAGLGKPVGDELKIGELTYTVLRGPDAIATMLAGKSKGNELGKLTDMDKLILALEGESGPCAVYVATKDNGTDDQGFRSVTTYASQVGQRAGRLALAGRIKSNAKKGMKYTGELRVAGADLVDMLPKLPKSEDIAAARGLLASEIKADPERVFTADNVDPDYLDGALLQAVKVRDAVNAHARLKLIQGTVACRWY